MRKASRARAWKCADEAANLIGCTNKFEGNSNYPDFKHLMREARKAFAPHYVIVSRHEATVKWLKEHDEFADAEIVSHITPEQAHSKIIVGNVPLNIAAEADYVVSVEIELAPEERGKELDYELIAKRAKLVPYVVKRKEL
ncbi:MAG: hypothetical protein HPY87_10260 [Fervidobacterium sp.]|uniref:CRISPR-associated protein Csx16 n=1 Tax=Fervidobacterium sp. TaxID=1871331 RepID=UPI0025C2B71D|nr:CRISPR-associated protein Csx16 [Fervidobacterium sp.]NPU90241.1 hypothetical protein [Fervidobacterium sp.]